MPEMPLQMNKSTSQFVADFFAGKTGKFLDIGADDGIGNDEEPYWNLLTNGWQGVYCEPNPYSLSTLLTNVAPYNATVVASALTPATGIQEFYASPSHPFLSSLDPEWHEIGMPPQSVHIEYIRHKMYVPTITAQQIFDRFGYDFDTISVDIEADEPQQFELVKSIDFNRLPNCKLVITEMCGSELFNYMHSMNFTYEMGRMNHYWYKE